MPNLALFQPDIPQNVGAAMRLCACLGMTLDVIEPCAFPWKEKEFRRSGLDYIDHVNVVRHMSWTAFCEARKGRRLILLTTKSAVPYTSVTYKDDDILLAGRESAGVPDEVHNAADARILIPMAKGLRSLNVINAASMVAGEALRQTGLFTNAASDL